MRRSRSCGTIFDRAPCVIALEELARRIVVFKPDLCHLSTFKDPKIIRITNFLMQALTNVQPCPMAGLSQRTKSRLC